MLAVPGACRAVFAESKNSLMHVQPLRILVIHVGGLTETALALPALRALRQHFTGSHICIATSAPAADLARLGHCADQVLPVARMQAEILSPSLLYRSLNSVRQLRQSMFDLVIELHESAESAFLLQMVRANERITATPSSRRTGLIHSVSRIALALAGQRRPPEHLAQRYLRRLEPIGVRPVEAEPRVTTEKDADARMEKWLEKSGVSMGDLLIGIDPGAGARVNRWPMERFVSIGQRLIHNFNARLIVVGGRSERGVAKQFVKSMPAKRAVALQSPQLSDLVSVLARLTVFVTNHAGPAHVAAAIGTPVVIASSMNIPADLNLLSSTHIAVRGISADMISEEEIYQATSQMIKANRAETLWKR